MDWNVMEYVHTVIIRDGALFYWVNSKYGMIGVM